MSEEGDYYKHAFVIIGYEKNPSTENIIYYVRDSMSESKFIYEKLPKGCEFGITYLSI